MRLFEDPDFPFRGTNIPNLPKFNDSDAYTWIIRKKGLYLISPTMETYHEGLDADIDSWIDHKLSAKEIQSDAKNANILIVGPYTSYKDFKITDSADARDMGLLTGRFWSKSKILSSWDSDEVLVKLLPEVIKMLHKGFNLSLKEISSVYIDLHEYDSDKKITSYSDVKQIKDLFNFKAKKQTQADKDEIKKRIQMHVEPDPVKRKQLQQQFGLNPDMTYKHGLPPVLRKYLKRDPSFFKKIDWSKWGLSPDEAKTLVQNSMALLEQELLTESPDSMVVRSTNKDLGWKDAGANAFSILSKDCMFTVEKGAHFMIYGTIEEIITKKLSSDQALKLIKKDGLRFFGKKELLEFSKLRKVFKSYKTTYPRSLGFTGRFWADDLCISAWGYPEEFLKKIDLVILLLQKFEFSESQILQFVVDVPIHEFDDKEISEKGYITINDVIRHKLSSKNKELSADIGQAHIEVDPVKRKLLKQKMGMNPDEFRKKVPNMILRQIQREPGIIDRIDWSKWGLSKDDVLLSALQLQEEVLHENPDSPRTGGYFNIFDNDVYCFIILVPGLYIVKEKGTHGDLLRLLVKAKNENYSVEQLIDAGKSSSDYPILFYGDISKLQDLSAIPNFENAYKSFTKSGFSTISERKYGFLTGRFFNNEEQDDIVISFWKDDKFVVTNIAEVVKFLRALGLTMNKIKHVLLDLGDASKNPISIETALQNKIHASGNMSKEKEEAMRQVHIETDPIKRKQLKKQLNMMPAGKAIKSPLDFLPKMVINQIKRDPSVVNRIDFGKWGLTRNDVVGELLAEEVEKQIVTNKKLGCPIYHRPRHHTIPLSDKYIDILKREPSLINHIDWNKFGMNKRDVIKMLTEDADNAVVNGKSLTPSRSDSIAFGYVDGLIFYKSGSNSNHQQIYYELKSRLAPNYPKLQKALQDNNLAAVNHFLKQIIAYLNGRGIDVVGDTTGLVKLLKDLYSNDIESLDLVTLTKSLETGGFEKMRDNAYKIRKDVFVVSGRAWREPKIVSFWNSVKQAKRCVEVFDLIDDVTKYRFEFIDNVGTFYTYEEIMRGSVKKGELGDMGKYHSESNPYKKQLRKKEKLDKMSEKEYDDYFKNLYDKRGGMNSWERERMRDLAEGKTVSDVFDKKGIGSTPNQIDIEYFGFVKEMTPKEFRSLVPSGVSEPETREKIIIPAIKQGKKISPPFLIVRWDEKHKIWKTLDHEGRSRTDAIIQMFGEDVEMPVHIIPMGIRAKNITDAMKNADIIPQK